TLVFLEIEIKMRERVILDVARRIPQRLELGQFVGHLLAPRDEVGLENIHRVLQLAVCERGVRVLLEGRGRRGVCHGWPADFSGRGAAIAGASVMPASTSATCRTAISLPSRVSLPAMFIRQPRSPASSVPAPLARMLATFLLTI